MKHYVITNADRSETQIVQSLDGYDGWRVLEEHRGEVPKHAAWEKGRGLRDCPRTKRDGKMAGVARNPDRMLEEHRKLLARVRLLEAQVAQLMKDRSDG